MCKTENQLVLLLSAGQELTAVHYEPPKPKPMVRPAYLYFMPSPAAMSFNFAVQSYQPSSSHSSTHDHSQSGQCMHNTCTRLVLSPDTQCKRREMALHFLPSTMLVAYQLGCRKIVTLE